MSSSIDALISICTAARRSNSEDALLAELAQLICLAMGADACDILLTEQGDDLVLRASTQLPEYNHRVRLGPGVGLSGQVLASQEPVFVSNAAESHKGFAKYPGIDDVPTESLAVLPLCVGEDAIGVCFLRKAVPWKFTAAEKERATLLATASAECFAGFHHAHQLGNRVDKLGALSQVSRTISTSPYLEEILQLLVNLTAQQFNYTVCTVRLLDEAQGELVLRATQATVKAYQRKRALKLGESIAGRAIKERQPIIVPDVQLEPDYVGHDLAAEQGLRSMICAPLMLGGRPVGVLSCYTSEVRDFQPDEIKALETLAQQAAVSIEHAKLQVRTTLMQEMHHRVKNNLQQVASLLRLQLRHSQFKSLDEAINDTLARILAISSVHDLLSREDLDHVGVRAVAEALVQHQQHTLVHPDRQIGFEVRGANVRLNMNQATQLALILNELIQNAVEHGFHVALSGEVHVTVEENDGEVAIWVSNSGDPLPEGFDVSKGHLGMQIVESLSRALGGKFKLGEILGWTVAEVKFIRASGE